MQLQCENQKKFYPKTEMWRRQAATILSIQIVAFATDGVKKLYLLGSFSDIRIIQKKSDLSG